MIGPIDIRGESTATFTNNDNIPSIKNAKKITKFYKNVWSGLVIIFLPFYDVIVLFVAETKLKEASKKTKVPSEMYPTTTVHELIKEIRCNVKSNLESKAKQSEG